MTVPGSPERVVVRPATAGDTHTVLRLVHALAEYEKLPPPDAEAERRLINDLFGAKPRIQVHLAEVNGEPVGYALVFESYSSFLALPTLYLEDIFVLPVFRKRKVGYALFHAMAEEALRRGCGRMEWTVLDWNTPALDFYQRAGARHLKEWQLFRLTRQEMEALCSGQ